jgi:hypothetical protein
MHNPVPAVAADDGFWWIFQGRFAMLSAMKRGRSVSASGFVAL